MDEYFAQTEIFSTMEDFFEPIKKYNFWGDSSPDMGFPRKAYTDEIQNIEDWEHFVNSKSQDFTGEYDIFASGSNSKTLSGELATPLSGRYVQFEVLPFSFGEYCGASGKEGSRQSYIDYMNVGALPELFVLPNEDTKRNCIASIKDTVLLHDIIQRQNIKDAKLLEDVFVYLVHSASNLVSITSIVNFFKSKNRKSAHETVANYAGYMEDAFLIHKAERYDIKGKDVIAGNCKYYPNGLSFKNYIYPGFGCGAGRKLENLAYLELRRAGFKTYVGAMRDKEVDFVARKGDRQIYIQSTYTLTGEDISGRGCSFCPVRFYIRQSKISFVSSPLIDSKRSQVDPTIGGFILPKRREA